jgi:hypothetical protein
MHRTALALAFAAIASSSFAQYEVRKTSGTQELTISLMLPGNAKTQIKLAPRGTAWGLKPQVSNVRCEGNLLPQDADGNWLAPAKCIAVTWAVLPDHILSEGADASEQRTLEIGQEEPWFLLAEPTALLRPHNTEGAMQIRAAPDTGWLRGATQVQKGYFRLPSSNNAPEFYVLGASTLTHRKLGQFDITYTADSPAVVSRLGLEALHATAFSYLSSVVSLPQTLPPSDRSLLVIWLAISETKGHAGGAAGSRSFVANYIVGEAENERLNAARTTAILAHEQFHQLVDLVRGDLPALPAWLSESLAHYYGLKALLVADDSESTQSVRNKFIAPKKSLNHGLLELNRRYKSGDHAAYELFYSQGATLWHEMDAAIAAATNGQRTLDNFIDPLLRLRFPADGSLPEPFIKQLRQSAGPTTDQIISRYIGE